MLMWAVQVAGLSRVVLREGYVVNILSVDIALMLSQGFPSDDIQLRFWHGLAFARRLYPYPPGCI